MPIMEVFSRKEQRESNARRGDSSSDDKNVRKLDSLSTAIMKAIFVFSIKAEGIRVTCVPGGSTRLTESPIINFNMRDYSFGLGICPVPVNGKILPDAALEGITEKKAVASSLRDYHMIVGAWLNCELSASYHNRRLVAWEPFIEPWTMEVRFGADLAKLELLHPLPNYDRHVWQTELPQGDTFTAFTGDKLREFRNYLSSPFRRSVGSEKEAAETTAKEFPIDSDFGYLMLALASNSLVASGLHPSVTSTSIKSMLLSVLPSRNPINWLVCFGHPRIMLDSDAKADTGPSVSCYVLDSKPLNMNLTGAFIENVLGYLKQEKSRTVAPHWIRNDSGLVR